MNIGIKKIEEKKAQLDKTKFIFLQLIKILYLIELK